MKRHIFRPKPFFILLCFLFFLSVSTSASSKEQDIIITLPASTVLSSLQKVMPMDLEPNNAKIEGKIVIQSIDKLEIKDNAIFIKGVIQGNNLSLVSKIANQNIRLKLGQLTLPISCALQIRFDKVKKELYVRPVFQSQENSSIKPLLNSLQKEEYKIPLSNLQLLNISLGTKTLPLTVTAQDIICQNNMLTLKLQPDIQGTK